MRPVASKLKVVVGASLGDGLCGAQIQLHNTLTKRGFAFSSSISRHYNVILSPMLAVMHAHYDALLRRRILYLCLPAFAQYPKGTVLSYHLIFKTSKNAIYVVWSSFLSFCIICADCARVLREYASANTKVEKG
jgi:hypothetical protein